MLNYLLYITASYSYHLVTLPVSMAPICGRTSKVEARQANLWRKFLDLGTAVHVMRSGLSSAFAIPTRLSAVEREKPSFLPSTSWTSCFETQKSTQQRSPVLFCCSIIIDVITLDHGQVVRWSLAATHCGSPSLIRPAHRHQLLRPRPNRTSQKSQFDDTEL
jgi:hypothetical protein